MDLGIDLIRQAAVERNTRLEEARREMQRRQERIEEVEGIALADRAHEYCRRIHEMIEEFDAALDQEHEVGVRLVSFGREVVFHIRDLGYYNPHLIVFHGVMEDGSAVQLVQHVSQISFLLMVLKRTNPDTPKQPFGFAAAAVIKE
ncbi:MAG: DUF6173 family protein [Pirellulales bacterium]